MLEPEVPLATEPHNTIFPDGSSVVSNSTGPRRPKHEQHSDHSPEPSRNSHTAFSGKPQIDNPTCSTTPISSDRRFIRSLRSMMPLRKPDCRGEPATLPWWSNLRYDTPNVRGFQDSCDPMDNGLINDFMNSGLLNGGYWASWKHYDGMAPSSIPLDSITHVHYAFADIKDDGTVYLADENAHYQAEIDGTKGGLRAWTQRKLEKPSLRVTLAIGGGDDSKCAQRFADIAADRVKRYTFTQSAKQLVELFELDGVDVDWEYPSSVTEAKHHVQLLAELRQALGWHRWVTTALPASRWAYDHIDFHEISKLVDFINLMAYDFVGPSFANISRTGHHAQLYVDMSACDTYALESGNGAVIHMIKQGVPSRKIMLGVPLYGRVFEGAKGSNRPFQGPGSGKDSTYEVKDLPRPGMSEHFSRGVCAAFAVGNNEFITYDNRVSVKEKAAYVKKNNLRGLFYWHLSGDRSGDASLIDGGYSVLSSKDAQRYDRYAAAMKL